MNVLITNHSTQDANRLSNLLRSYGHIPLDFEDVEDTCDYDAVIFCRGWHNCPSCRNIRYEAVNSGKTIAYESDLDRLDLRTLRDPAASPRREYRTLETSSSILVQVRGLWLGLWHTVKEYPYAADPAYAHLLAAELIDKLTDD